MRVSLLASLVLAAAIGSARSAPPVASDPEAPRIGPSNLPVPRYVSLKSDQVNARQGPSFSHPVLWQYRRAGLPLKVTAESGPWRRVGDLEGAQAWVHVATLSGQRTAVVMGARTAIRRRAAEGARPRAWLEPGVVANLLDCKGGWRKLSVKGRSGWAPASALWGAPSCPASGGAAPRA